MASGFVFFLANKKIVDKLLKTP